MITSHTSGRRFDTVSAHFWPITGAEVDDAVTVSQLRVMMMIATLGAINFAAARRV